MEEVRAKAVGINHVALEVGNVEEALRFYGKLFDFSVRKRNVLNIRNRPSIIADIVMGDQFIALIETEEVSWDNFRHFGIAVNDLKPTQAALKNMGVDLVPGRGLNFLDPWGNFVEVMDYRNMEFLKSDVVLKALGIEEIKKSEVGIHALHACGLDA